MQGDELCAEGAGAEDFNTTAKTDCRATICFKEGAPTPSTRSVKKACNMLHQLSEPGSCLMLPAPMVEDCCSEMMRANCAHQAQRFDAAHARLELTSKGDGAFCRCPQSSQVDKRSPVCGVGAAATLEPQSSSPSLPWSLSSLCGASKIAVSNES